MGKDKNIDLRFEIESSGLRYYQVADQIGIDRNSLSRWFRTEMSDIHRMRVEKAIRELLKKNRRR